MINGLHLSTRTSGRNVKSIFLSSGCWSCSSASLAVIGITKTLRKPTKSDSQHDTRRLRIKSITNKIGINMKIISRRWSRGCDSRLKVQREAFNGCRVLVASSQRHPSILHVTAPSRARRSIRPSPSSTCRPAFSWIATAGTSMSPTAKAAIARSVWDQAKNRTLPGRCRTA